jgi:hypothetical protein
VRFRTGSSEFLPRVVPLPELRRGFGSGAFICGRHAQHSAGVALESLGINYSEAFLMQLSLNFEPGLAERHRSLKACVRERVYGSPKPLKAIAADMDLSESDLSRKLSDSDEKRCMTLDDLEGYLSTTGDVTPIYYLIEKYAVSIEAKQAFAAAEFAKLLPTLQALAKQMGAA